MNNIFFEPGVNKITVGSIIRIDLELNISLDQVEELKGFNYEIRDSYKNTYYIMPISKKSTVKPKTKLGYSTRGGDMEFNYFTSEWKREKKVRERTIEIKFHESQEQEVSNLISMLDLYGCPDEDKDENGVITYSETFVEYDPDEYKVFKNALKAI